MKKPHTNQCFHPWLLCFALLILILNNVATSSFTFRFLSPLLLAPVRALLKALIALLAASITQTIEKYEYRCVLQTQICCNSLFSVLMSRGVGGSSGGWLGGCGRGGVWRLAHSAALSAKP